MQQSELILRDWGTTEDVPMREGHQIQQITVNPGARLPLRINDFQCEHWVVVQGTGRMTLDLQSFLVDVGGSSFIPARASHSIENVGEDSLRIVAVHFGSGVSEKSAGDPSLQGDQATPSGIAH